MEPYAWRRIYTFRIRQPTSQHPVGSSLVIPKSPQVSNGKEDDAYVKRKKNFLLIKGAKYSFSFRQCPSNRQHHFAVWCFGHHATSWDVASVSPFTK